MGQPWDGGYGTGDPSAGGYGSGGQPPGGYGSGGQPPGGYGAGYGYGEQYPGGYGGGYGPGGYGPGGGYGYGVPDPDPKAKTQAIIALCCNAAGFFCCWPVAIGGVIVSIIALTKADTEGQTARTLNMWAWILLGVEVVIGIAFIALYAFGVFASMFQTN